MLTAVASAATSLVVVDSEITAVGVAAFKRGVGWYSMWVNEGWVAPGLRGGCGR